jgi:transcriptional regulator with XRE-family HTH domain
MDDTGALDQARHQRLWQAFTASGLTQRELAILVASHESTVSNWLTAKAIPSLEKLEQMALAVGVQMAWLAYGVGPMRVKR